jgi:antirestriction protein ArdC
METQHIDVYQIVTNSIIEQLEHNVIPWQKPWTEAGYPQNLLTKAPYRGINNWLLGSLGYAQNYFLTWKQIKAVGGSVIKGEKGHIIVFWKKLDQNQPRSDESPKVVLRYYKVFNIAQCDHLPEVFNTPCTPHTISTFGGCEEIIERMPNAPVIKHSKNQAYYNSDKDYINIPPEGLFTSLSSYYSTLFHELVHSTGHASRLNRKEIVEKDTFGSNQYSIEELTAQIGASYLNSIAGIGEREFQNDVAYIKGWIEVLKNDKRFIVYASGQAQKATDYILNVQPYAKATVDMEEEAKTQ